MKKILLISLSFMLLNLSMKAQQCGTPDHTPSERSYFLNTIKNYMIVKNSGTTCIPIKPYIFRETDGSGGVNLESLNKGIANLNHKYLEAGIEFYYSSVPIYIDNSDLNNFDERAPDNDTEAMLIAAAGEVTNAVNIYFVESITDLSSFQAAGYAYFPSPNISSNRILMIHDAVSGNINGTFIHEFGHYFSLPHTFSGTSNGNADANAENVPRTGANANCSTHGDSFCDTDADPRYEGADFSSATCTHSGTDTDINGVLYNPLTAITNVMSYYSDACVEGFTAEQYTAIAQGLVARQGFVNYTYSAPPMTVTPPSGLIVTLSGGVSLAWTDNASNEMGYIIERSTTSAISGFQAIVEGGTNENATTFYDNTANASNTTYYYRVKASNGDCNSYSNVVSVLTDYCGAGASSCDEILTNVTVGSINNSSVAADCSINTYQNFTALSTLMTTGTTYPVSMTIAPSYAEDSISVWIDWNQDEDFDDVGETIFTEAVSFGAVNNNITPPMTALSGATRMRIRLFYQTGNSACGIGTFGEVEDYTINVISTAPVVAIANNNLSGFTYVAGGGPSADQSNSVTWANLVSNVTSINTIDYFEFSTDGGTTFNPASTALNIAIPPFPASFGPQSIEIRMIAGLVAGTYKDTIYLSTSDGGAGTIVDTTYLSGIVTSASIVACSELLISEYGEPSSGNGKYIELYNGTSGTVDLSNYRIDKHTNGGSGSTSSFVMTGMLLSGETWVIGNNSTDVPSSNQNNGGVCSFNGDDVIELLKDVSGIFTIIDEIGHNTGVDPGAGWAVAGTSNATKNKTLKRKTTIQVPNDDWTSSAGTSVADSEWEVITYSQSDLGSHITACVAVCSISAMSAGTQTGCVTATNEYTQEVIVTYSTAPSTGTLDVNGQSFAITTSPQTIVLTSLTSDGAAVNISASFSANAACSLSSVALFTAPVNCSATCNISGITAGTQTACASATNTYTQEVTVTYAVPPASGTLDVNGQSFTITTSPQTVILTALTSDGSSVNVTAVFSADAGCTFTSNSLFTAAADCTPVAACSELLISEYVEDGGQKYIEIYNPTGLAVDLTNYDVVVYSNANTSPNSPINISGSLASGGVYVIKGSGANAWTGTADLSTGSLSFNGNDAVALRNSGAIIDIVGPIGNTVYFGDNRTLTRLSTIQVPNDTYDIAEWTTTSPYSVTSLGLHTTSCVAVCSISALSAGTQTGCVTATNEYTQEVIVTYSTAPSTGTLDVNGQSFVITTSPQTVVLTSLTSDGAAVNISASFSANAACSLSSVALFTAPVNCSATCNISGITAGTQTACASATNTYTQEVTVTYAVPPVSGTLDVNGQSFTITTSPQTVILTALTSDGGSVNVTAVFSADAGCTFTANTLFTATADCTPIVACSELLISEYGEPSSGNGKYIELYNGTSGTVDLSNYRIDKQTNGGSGGTSSFVMTGMLLSGETWIIGNNSTDVPSSNQNNGGVCSFNGDDVIELLKDVSGIFTIIDEIGHNTGVDPGAGWTVAGTSNATKDKTLKRKTTIQVPNNDWTSSAGTSVADSEWEVITYSQSDLGSHVTACVILTFDWLGTTNTDWNTASNWSSGIIPSVTDDVTISDVSGLSGNFPLITPAITLGNIVVNSGASLEIVGGIILDGTFTNNGTVTLQDGAYLDDFSNIGASYVGNIIIETAVSNGVGNDQRFISSPINTPNISEIGDDLTGPWGIGLPGINGVAVTVDDCALQTLTSASNYGNLFELDETIMTSCSVDGWVVRSSGSLENARGYSAYLANGSTFDFEGTPNTGNVSIAATNTGSGVINGEGWNLIGNPYPSPISRDDLINLTGAVDAQYYETSGVYIGSFTPYLPSSNIAIAQGFQVRVNSNTTISMDNNFRNTNASTWYSNEEWFTHKLEISVFGATRADKTILFYNDEATTAYEPLYDVSKRKSSLGNPTLATFNGSKELALNGMSVNNLGDIVPMNLYSGENGSFSLSFEGMETFPINTTIYVKDLLLEFVHNIADGDYVFTSNTSDSPERFEIIFIPEVKFETASIGCEGEGGNISLISTIGVNDRSFELLNTMNIVSSNDLVNLNQDLEEGAYILNINDQYGGVQVYNFAIDKAESIIANFETSSINVEVDEVFNLSNLTPNALNIDWNIENNIISNVDDFTYSFSNAGVYDVVQNVSNQDCSASKTKMITVSNKTTEINYLINNRIEIYPNPVNDVLHIITNEKIKVEIYTVLGKKVLEFNDKDFSVKSLNKGIFIVQIFNSNHEIISINKLVKE